MPWSQVVRRRVLDALRREIVWRRAGRAVLLVLVACAGALVGLALAGSRTEHVGPLIITTHVTFSWTGDTVVDVPPLGSIVLDSHDGPLQLDAEVQSLDTNVTEAAISGGPVGNTDVAVIASQVRHLVIWTYLQALLVSVVGASLAVFVVWRRRSWVAITAGTVTAVMLPSAGVGALTWNQRAIAQPRYTGLLVFVPQVVGDADVIVKNFQQYGDQLGGLVQNVAQLATAARNLPTLQGAPDAALRARNG